MISLKSHLRRALAISLFSLFALFLTQSLGLGEWTSVTPPSVSRDWTAHDVHFTSPDEGWVVGADWENRKGFLLHYSGGAWTSVPPPERSSSRWWFSGVHFTSPDEGWAVGIDLIQEFLTIATGVLLHYSGGVWTAITPPTVSSSWALFGVHFTSPDEGWAVGKDNSSSTGVLLRYSNGEWVLAPPPVVSANWQLSGVHFTSPDDGWAVGRTTSTENINTGVLLHYSGGAWTSVTPPYVEGEDYGLTGVHFTSSDEGWAVGTTSYTQRGVLLHYSGGAWTSVTPPEISANWGLGGVHLASADKGWAVGVESLNHRGVLLHYSGGAWTSVTVPELDSDWFLRNIHFTSPYEGWAVGETGYIGPNTRTGVLLHYTSPVLHALTVNRTGSSGSGIVTSTPAGITCGSDCTETYVHGTAVNLTATADTGSVFGEWSGCDSVADTVCTVMVNEDRDVTATFHLSYSLGINREGTGNGTITSSPSGIECEPTCSSTFVVGTQVQLTAQPNASSFFSYWSGACSGTTNTCDLDMTENMEAIAHFVSNTSKEYVLNVTRVHKKNGDGTVTSTDGNITCGNQCSHSYFQDAVVTLTATAYTLSTFLGWSSSSPTCLGTGPCWVTLDKKKSVKAVFQGPNRLKVVTTYKNGGAGTVTSGDAFINCPGDCEEPYILKAPVTLTATAGDGSSFVKWIGKPCKDESTNVCTFEMNKNATVKAIFQINPE